METTSRRADLAIWIWAFGYFAAYVPYSALTKALSSGELGPPGLTGLAILPISTLASLVGMAVFISAAGWWKAASHARIAGVSLPVPTRWTLLSGLCTAAIIGTTTLAYTFSGTSIVFMMLLMRGGVLVIAPAVDLLTRRKVQWYSWGALGLSLVAVGVATTGRTELAMTWPAVLDVAIYLGAYFIRLRFMSRLAKSEDANAQRRYFVEEQMVATPAIVAALALAALAGGTPALLQLREGFTSAWSGGHVIALLAIGIFSQGTGVFGGLILLDRRENSFCVPVNRASSILAGVTAGFAMAVVLDHEPPQGRELLGALLVLGAIALLSLPPVLKARVKPATLAGMGPPST